MKDEVHKDNLNTEYGFEVFLSQTVCTLQEP